MLLQCVHLDVQPRARCRSSFLPNTGNDIEHIPQCIGSQGCLHQNELALATEPSGALKPDDVDDAVHSTSQLMLCLHEELLRCLAVAWPAVFGFRSVCSPVIHNCKTQIFSTRIVSGGEMGDSCILYSDASNCRRKCHGWYLDRWRHA